MSIFSLFLVIAAGTTTGNAEQFPQVRVTGFAGPNAVNLEVEGTARSAHTGEQIGSWTVMEISDSRQYAVLEDFTRREGHILFVDARGVRLDLPKSCEGTWTDLAKLYLGHSLDEVIQSPSDLLGDQILSNPSDPDYNQVAAALPPIQKMPTYSFVGTNQSMDKVGVAYGGRTPNFDPAPYDPAIKQIREQGRVMDGLVGGSLPVLRFVFPETPETWTEMLAFAPMRLSNGNDRVQPVWYRLVHVDHGVVKWTRYVDSYHPFPPRTEYDPKIFYQDLIALSDGWNKTLAPALKIELADKRLENMARFSLVRDLMTRIGDFPKYGVVDKDYAGSEHDGFPDTFNVDTAAMLEWGMTEVAGRFIDNYFGKFVRDDGSILYRGPETGQYGRMLTVLAQFVSYGGDSAVLLKHQTRIDGVTRLLLHLREQAKRLPKESPAYGMIAGWSEADASLDPDPPRYMQPYFSNSAEAVRGLRDLGGAWIKIAAQTKDNSLKSWGERLVHESRELQTDLQEAISRSLLQVDGEIILPAIAGVKEPFHVAVPRDPTDPQFRSYRAYMEMMFSGVLTSEQVEMIVSYRRKHHDTILGVPTAYGFNTGILAGFLSYGHGYGLIQHDKIREALLTLYAVMAHQYTRGTWTAPETRPVFRDDPAAPYCTPAQLVVPLMARWMLVFEDSMSDTLWLGKAIPRAWFQQEKVASISGAPTRWGRVGFTIASHLADGTILVTVALPVQPVKATVQVRLRAPEGRHLRSVELNGKPWGHFDAQTETITLPSGMSGRVDILAHY